jgi:putative ABC transport system ATP-binding protein
LAERLHHHPSELSGGEAQRVAVARALIRRPRLVLADEPTGSLDARAGRLVFEEFRALQRERRFLALLATHDGELAGRCDRTLEMSEGRVAAL